MNILVFGANGMLGRYVCSRLSQEHSVTGLTRKELDLSSNFIAPALLPFLNNIDVTINCAGIIKSRSDVSSTEYTVVNRLFPVQLAIACKEQSVKMIHVTTDCVYDGYNNKPYVETDEHTAKDWYGSSKSFGEKHDGCTIRTSIVGEEIGQKRSLIEWAKSQKGKTVYGYRNHYWNGVSCLQLAEVFSSIIKDKLFWTGVRHVFSPNVVTKYELLKIISDVFNLELNIESAETGRSQRYLALGTLNLDWGEHLKSIPEIKEQLVKMRDFKLQ